MADTSIGGILVGLLLGVVGIAAVVAGGVIVIETTFAQDGQSSAEWGPMGLLGGSEESQSSVDLAPVLGLVLVAGGIAATITGFVMTRGSFERGKDRSVHEPRP